MNVRQPGMPAIRTTVAMLVAFGLSAAALSAHSVVGLLSRGFTSPAKAFVSSPTSGTDRAIPLKWGNNDSGLRAICFYVANTSTERADRRAWPRITAAGFELPGRLSGFTLLEPLDGKWALVEDQRVRLDGETVKLDFAIVASAAATQQPWSPRNPRGIPPGQPAERGNGTRFCVSGPFPDEPPPSGLEAPPEPTTMRIEDILNGVVVGFEGVDGTPFGIDAGVWDNPSRLIPLFPKK
jgi:hypothetical protein